MYYPSARRKGPIVAVIVMLFLSISIIASTYVYEHYFTSNTQTTIQATPLATMAPSSSTNPARQIQQVAENAGQYGTGYQVTDRSNYNFLVVETLRKMAATQIRPGIKSDCFAIQHAIWTSNFKISQLVLQFVGSAYDKYGNATTTTLGSCTLDSATARHFVWNNLTADTAWDQHAYTSTTLSPSVY
jgi:hypothetical protein